jgi:hypothetical protein
MKTRIILPLLLCICAGFISCEKTIKVELPGEPSRLVMTAIVQIGTPIRLDLSRTRNLKETSAHAATRVDGATVVLYVDGKAADTLKGPSADQVTSYTSFINAVPGKTYRLTVHAAGYDDIEATAAAPAVVPIRDVELKPNVQVGKEGNSLDALTISFKDPAAENDHYIVLLASAYESITETDFYSWRNCVFTTDPSVDNANASDDPFGDGACISSNNILVQDELFNGTEKKLTVYVYATTLDPQQDWQGGMIYAHAYLLHVSEDFYKYLRSYRQVLNSSGNPFAEPSNVVSNVKGGYGIFAIINGDIAQVEL